MLFLTVNWVSVSLTLIEESLETSNVYSLLAISNLEINYLKVTSVALSVYIGKNVLQSIRKKHIKCDISDCILSWTIVYWPPPKNEGKERTSLGTEDINM